MSKKAWPTRPDNIGTGSWEPKETHCACRFKGSDQTNECGFHAEQRRNDRGRAIADVIDGPGGIKESLSDIEELMHALADRFREEEI